MNHLKRHYRDSLTRRIAALETHLQNLRHEGEHAGAVAEIRGLAHALKGSGATYGFAVISETAAATEEAPVDHLPEALDHLLTILRETVAEISSTSGESSPAQGGG